MSPIRFSFAYPTDTYRTKWDFKRLHRIQKQLLSILKRVAAAPEWVAARVAATAAALERVAARGATTAAALEAAH